MPSFIILLLYFHQFANNIFVSVKYVWPIIHTVNLTVLYEWNEPNYMSLIAVSLQRGSGEGLPARKSSNNHRKSLNNH